MNIDVSALPDNAEDLKEIIKSLKDLEQEKQSRIDFLEERIRLLQNELFGRKTEKPPRIDRKQLLLFHEDQPEATGDTAEPEKITIPKHTRKKCGRKPLPDHLPRFDVLVDIKDEEKICGCGHELSPMGSETSEKLEIIPAKVLVIRYIRPKYACKVCEGVEDDGPSVKIAPLSPRLFPKALQPPVCWPISLHPYLSMRCLFTGRRKYSSRWALNCPAPVYAAGPSRWPKKSIH
jgi:transposase